MSQRVNQWDRLTFLEAAAACEALDTTATLAIVKDAAVLKLLFKASPPPPPPP